MVVVGEQPAVEALREEEKEKEKEKERLWENTEEKERDAGTDGCDPVTVSETLQEKH